MKSSFGGGMGGAGGGGKGGSGMLRAVHRAVRTGRTVGGGGSQDSFSSSATTTATAKTAKTTKRRFNNKTDDNSAAFALSSSSPFSALNKSAATVVSPNWGSSSYYTDEESDDWERLDGCEDERENILFDDFSNINNILRPVPSEDEVHRAVSALQVLKPSNFSYYTKEGLGYNSNGDTTDELSSSINLTREVSSSESVSDWIEPSMHICNSKLLQSYGASRVYDAFHLLQTDPSIQKMVISLSSDKAVWDAVLNNEAVREIRDSLKQADDNLPSSEDGLEKSDRSDGTVDIVNWIIVNTKEKVMEIVGKIIEFVNEWFHPPEKEISNSSTDPFEEKLRTSFFLSVVVLLIVVVARAQNA